MYLWLAGDSWEQWGGDGNNRALVNQGWTPDLQSNVVADDSDKTFTVPTDTEWIVEWMYVDFTTTAVVGTRQLTIQIQDDSANIIGEVVAGVSQAASLHYYYMFAADMEGLTALRDSVHVSNPMPKWILPAGYAVRILDSKSIDAAADDMLIRLMVQSRVA